MQVVAWVSALSAVASSIVGCTFGNVSSLSWQRILFCVHLDILNLDLFLQKVVSVGRTICQIFRQQPSAGRLIIGEEIGLHPPHIINPKHLFQTEFFWEYCVQQWNLPGRSWLKCHQQSTEPLVITGQHSAKWLHSFVHFYKSNLIFYLSLSTAQLRLHFRKLKMQAPQQFQLWFRETKIDFCTVWSWSSSL